MDYKAQYKVLADEVDKLRQSGMGGLTALQSCCNVGNCSPNNATLMVTEAIKGWEHSSFYYSLALNLQGRVKTFVKAMESIAYLDLSSDVLAAKGVKDSSEARKRVVDQQEDVIAASELFSKVEAMVCFFEDKKWQFKMAYDALKKVGMNDPSVGDNSFGR